MERPKPRRLWAAVRNLLRIRSRGLESMDLRSLHKTLHDLFESENWLGVDALLEETSDEVPSIILIGLIHCTALHKTQCRSWEQASTKAGLILHCRGERDPGLASLKRLPVEELLR